MAEPAAVETQDQLSAVHARLEPSLLRYALRLTGNAEQARDAVQDAFARLIESQRGDSLARRADVEIDWPALTAWLFTVCRNRVIDAKRRERRMTAISLSTAHGGRSNGDGAGGRSDPGSAAAGPLDVAAEREASARVAELLAALPERQQQVVRLKFQHGLRYAEIAELTGLSATNVGFLIHTALSAIRKRMPIGE